MTSDEMSAVWSTIESEARREPGWHVRKISKGPIHDLQAGRRMPSGAVGLLYELDAGAVPIGTEWPDGKGFRTEVRTLADGPAGRIRVSLELTGPQYRDVFAALCGDIAAVVAAESTSSAGFGAFLRRLHAWQKFMQLHSELGLSAESVRGLFAEIHVIESLLAPMLGDASAIDAWQGRHGLHDFLRSGHALEIKSSTVTDDPVIRISRLDQFDETLVSSLHLCHVPLQEDGANGTNLPEVVSRLRGRLACHPSARQRFDDLLVAAGYHDIRASAYAEPRFRPGALQLYRICEGFPRFRRHEVPEGIIAARYSVRLATCADWASELDSLEAVFRGGGDGHE